MAADAVGGDTFEQQFDQKLSEAITTGGVVVGSQIMNQMLSTMADDPDAP
jgi:Rod binding domain-containing protein